MMGVYGRMTGIQAPSGVCLLNSDARNLISFTTFDFRLST
jgi:hypothetical protein